jgi:hypothetical protein
MVNIRGCLKKNVEAYLNRTPEIVHVGTRNLGDQTIIGIMGVVSVCVCTTYYCTCVLPTITYILLASLPHSSYHLDIASSSG